MLARLPRFRPALPQEVIACEKRQQCLWLTILLIGLTALTPSCGFSSGQSASPAPSLSISPSSATVTSHGIQQFSATALNLSNTNVSWSTNGGTISSSGLFTAPTVKNSTNFTVAATSVGNSSLQAAATITVNPPAPLSILTSALPPATTGESYSLFLFASGGLPPYQWTVSSGSLPTGLQLNEANGLLTGTTGASGEFALAATITDASLQETTKSFTLQVNAAGGSVFIPADFFGMHVAISNTSLSIPAPWGTPILSPIVVGALGKCVTSVWSYVETTPGKYDWSQIDQCTDWAAHFGIKYFQSSEFMTPASIGATDPTYDPRCWPSAVSGTYFCQGTMTAAGETQWINFNAAMALHYRENPGMDFYEGWNEPPYAGNATAPTITATQLARYEVDRVTAIRANDPNAKIASPGFIIDSQHPAYATFMVDFLEAKPPAYDYYDFHIDYSTAPEDEIPMITLFKQILAQHGIVSPRIYATEAGRGGSGEGGTCPGWPSQVTTDLQQAFIARMELLYWSQGIQRHYWYAYDTCGTLTNQPTSDSLNSAGIAYSTIERWMIGASMSQPCTGPAYPGTGVWTCGLTKADGTQAMAVWDSSQSCAGRSCSTSSYSYPSEYTKYYTLSDESSQPLIGGTVQIGAKPILLSE